MPSAASLNARLSGRSRRTKTAGAPPRTGLAGVGGSLIGVVALHGGAGASTLTWLLAAAAARESKEPVLAIDAAGPLGSLASHAGARPGVPLADVSLMIAARQQLPDPLFSEYRGVRLLAGVPAPSTTANAAALTHPQAGLLSRARQAHALTAVDCGRGLSPEAAAVLAVADITVVMAAASPRALSQARHAWNTLGLTGRVVLAVREDDGQAPAAVKSARDMAAEIGAHLLTVPRLDPESTLANQVAQASVTLTALAQQLRGARR